MEEEKIEIKVIEPEDTEEMTDVIYINVGSDQLNQSEEESNDLEYSLTDEGMPYMLMFLPLV